MHFVDREKVSNPPTAILSEYKVKYQADWAQYNTARANNQPLPKRPPSSWLDNEIRNPLKYLFLKNCGYCGIHTDLGNDAEVDHHFPTSNDLKAEQVFSWDNYIWSCPSCNGLKKHNHPVLNPCSLEEMQLIYFHSSSGRYLFYNEASKEIIAKYEVTDKYTNINGKNRPARRKNLFRSLIECDLSGLRIALDLFQVESEIHGVHSIEAIAKKEIVDLKRQDLIELINCGDYLFLIKFAIALFEEKNNYKFPFTFEEILFESGYIN